ncbi:MULTISPECIES: carbohydrate ABC transporter permease [unclassified Arthrobacter]|uniref:carbohydrate ABC transporter permease n=1 Tax=unclassified Arthrobacter TaxID=235627 RepID=UPI001C85B234|nr:carbohydrate ABC transporter permease [Arthrobacter sp. MAHUQ-56]MBX7445925.1 carbohydrate ABC transporter permease [Arthrobacter sp. MAHUQ-56]
MFKYTGKTLTREILIFAIGIVLMIPFFFLVNIAFKSNADALVSPAIAPPNPITGESFATAFAGQDTRSIPLGALNSAIITSGTLLVLISLGSITAYALDRLTGRLRGLMYGIFFLAVLLPTQLGVVPLYVAMRSVGLTGTHLGMIVLYSAQLMPLAVFLYSGFVRAVPREYEQAAQIDGAGKFKTFSRVIFPLLAPATGTVAIMCGLICWNDFFNALIFLSGTPTATLPVVVYGFVSTSLTNWNVVFASVVLAMAPALVFYLLAQKRFMQGFAGGIKS